MYGPIGTEFVATNYNEGKPLDLGDILPVREGEDRTLQVIGFDGVTWSGAQWYKFRIVAASDSITESSSSNGKVY
jgi:hypothetical protein